MITDPIADMLNRIKNAQARGKAFIELPHSNLKESVAKTLWDNKFVGEVKTFKLSRQKHKGLKIELLYDSEGHPAINSIERISKSGLRKYSKAKDIRPVLNGLGIYIVSTSQGVMSSGEAKKKKLGGELVCRVY